MKIDFVTGSAGKLAEAKAILGEDTVSGLDIDLPEIQEMDIRKIIEYKLEEALKHSKNTVMVEDTELNLECLGGLPGPLIRWFMKMLGAEGIYKLCKNMGNNKAKARVAVGVAKSINEKEYFEGEIKGEIVTPTGEGGFGWDVIFRPEGEVKTFAQMTSAEKNQMSMRRIALGKLKEYLTTSG